MKLRAVLLLAMLLLPGISPAPVPLLVGTVRDRHGAPIARARIDVRDATGKRVRTLTASDGTFAVEIANARDAVVRCAFCQTTHIDVVEGTPLVAVVLRYDAVSSTTPSNDDVRHVPSSDAASALALTPFVVLERTSHLLPGPSLSDRGLSRSGGLAVVDGAPVYDVVSELSPYYAIPRRYVGSAQTRAVQDAYLYDDSANGGTFFVDPSESGAAYGGFANGSQGAFAAGEMFAAAAFSSESASKSARASALVQHHGRTIDTSAGVFDASARVGDTDDALDESTSGARVTIANTEHVDSLLSAWVDRGAYDMMPTPGYPSAAWSDAVAQLSVRSRAALAPFASVEYAHRAGWWNARSSFAASVDEMRYNGGLSLTTPTVDAVLEAGSAHATFRARDVASYALSDALARVTYHPASHWSLDASVSTGYRLPPLLVEYSSPLLPDDSYTDRDRTIQSTLSYTDASRVRVAFTAASRRTSGLDEGTTTSAGASFAWQITPQLSLRAWTLHVAPTLSPKPAAVLAALPLSASPAVVWFTYDQHRVRADLLWRRELIDWHPSPHIDAAISGPLGSGTEWFVSTERQQHATGIDAGIRF